MKNLLNIPVAFCLIGFISNPAFGTNFSSSQASYSEYTITDGTHFGDFYASIFSRLYPFLAFAETSNYVHSEIDPKSLVNAPWSIHQNTVFPQFQYLNRSQNFTLSQSARSLIYPFHSYL